MSENCVDRLQRLLKERQQEWEATQKKNQILADQQKSQKLQGLQIENEIEKFSAEMNLLTDEELKSKGKNFLHRKLTQAKELEEERMRRDPA